MKSGTHDLSSILAHQQHQEHTFIHVLLKPLAHKPVVTACVSGAFWKFLRADGPSDIVLEDGDPAPPPQKGGKAPFNFRSMSIVAKQLDGSKWHLAQRWASVQATLC